MDANSVATRAYGVTPVPGTLAARLATLSRICSNPSGTLTVWLTPAGLPLHVEIAPSLLSRGADAVAGEVLRLCQRRG